jgi:hypothetical protein
MGFVKINRSAFAILAPPQNTLQSPAKLALRHNLREYLQP